MNHEKLLQIARLAEPLSRLDMMSFQTCAVSEARKAGVIPPRIPCGTDSFTDAANTLDITYGESTRLFGSFQTGAECAAKIRRFVGREMG
jgi:hypothetical protein